MLKKDQKGFTIIEVLIVLAIAGLIMLIVFLAVPALQRNSRNTQYRNDVASYLGGVNEWITNNNGQVPVTANLAAINAYSKLGTMTPQAAIITGVQTATVGIGELQLVTAAKCNPASIGDSMAGVGSRAYVVRYSVESSTGSGVKQCLES